LSLKIAKMNRYIKFVFLLMIAGLYGQEEKVNFLIASGSRGGNYYRTGHFIARQYNTYLKNGRFRSIETNGSEENIRLLRNNQVDFAVVQRNILLNNIYNDEAGIKNVVVITPLFEEKLWIYIHGKKSVPFQALDSLSGKKKLKVGFTGRRGYSYKIFRTLLQFLDINYENFEDFIANYDTLTARFLRDSLDMVVSFSLPLASLDTFPGVTKVYLERVDAEDISNRLRNLTVTVLDTSGAYTLGSWSFFVGLRSVLDRISDEHQLVNALFVKTDDSVSRNLQALINQSFRQFSENKHQEAVLLRNLPLSASLSDKIGFRNINWRPYFYVFLLFLLLLFLNYFNNGRFIPRIRLGYIWQRYKHFQFGFIVLIILYFAGIELLVYSEKVFYKDIGIKSQILNMTRPDLHSWLLVTTLTGNSNGIFPLSTLGKIMLALNSINFWIGTVLIGVSEYVTYTINKKRKKGLMKTKHTGHLVIFGWNHTTEKFLLEVIKESKVYLKRNIDIVCVVDDVERVRTEYEKAKALHDTKKLDMIKGDALDHYILEMANVHKADTVILLSDDRSKHADERTVMRAHAISRFVKKMRHIEEKKPETMKERMVESFKKLVESRRKRAGYEHVEISDDADYIYMIAEINNEEFRESLIDADVNEIVIAGNYRKAIIKQSLFNHGISRVIDEIMQYNDYNEFYKIDLADPANAFLVGKTFDELLIILREAGILLIGYHIIFHDSNDNIVIDRQEIERLLKEHEPGITRDIIVNPIDPAEKSRPVDNDDHLIVLAVSMKALEEGLARLRGKFDNQKNPVH